MTQKVLRVGSSAAVTIPKQSLADLGLKIGDTVSVKIDTTHRAVTITPELNESTDDARIAKLTMRFIKRYRADLLALAKK